MGVEELRAEASRQSDHYTELCKAHETLLETKAAFSNSVPYLKRPDRKRRWVALEY